MLPTIPVPLRLLLQRSLRSCLTPRSHHSRLLMVATICVCRPHHELKFISANSMGNRISCRSRRCRRAWSSLHSHQCRQAYLTLPLPPPRSHLPIGWLSSMIPSSQGSCATWHACSVPDLSLCCSRSRNKHAGLCFLSQVPMHDEKSPPFCLPPVWLLVPYEYNDV